MDVQRTKSINNEDNMFMRLVNGEFIYRVAWIVRVWPNAI